MHSSLRARYAGAARLVAAAALGASVLAGCSELGGTGGSNFIPGKGTVTEVAVADRDAPVEVSGTTLDGEHLDVADLRGDVVVLNMWGSWCSPCREEAPELAALSKELTDARFVGVNVRETSKENALAYERTFGITFPSLDDQSGKALLALRGAVPPTATPSTLVLDREGRVAARILGPLPSAGTLRTLVRDVGAERG